MIIDEPSSPDSKWIEPAGDLLTNYQTQRDIYRVCLNAEFCNPRLGFQSLIETILNDEYPDLIDILAQAGVDLRSRGFFDFDNSGESEQWVVIRHQTGTPQEFWIISPNETHLHTVYVTDVNDITPGISYLEPITEPPIIVLEPDITFHYIRLGPENEPVIVYVEPEVIYASDRTEQDLDNLEEILLSGGDPAFIQEELLILRESPHFTCSFLLCPRFLYLLGLASELANDEFSAVAAYLDLWRDYPGHPYTIMARFKLETTFEPTPTPLPTSVVTSVPSIPTSTPNTTFTPTAEGYPPPGYPPPGSIPTNTPPPNPYPYPTP